MMQTLTIQRYDQLSLAQWKRVVVTAKRRVAEITGQKSEIGVGRKYRRGKPVGANVALRVYLPHKRRRVANDSRVPETFAIRLRRDDGNYDLLRIRSDVESLAEYIPTSARVTFDGRNAAAGLLLSWCDDGGETAWGFATVGHLFDDSSRRGVSVRVSATTRFQCQRYRAPAKRELSDLAVIKILGKQNEIERKLKDEGLIESQAPAVIRFMTADQVRSAAAEHRRGRTYSPDGDQPFTGEEVFPNGFRLGKRKLDDCIRVGRSPADTFRLGTSGSYWSFGGQAACLQVGGKAPEFREGIGQPIERFMDWIRSDIGESAKLVAVLD